MFFNIFKTKPKSLFDLFFLRSWWILLFSLFCLMFYEQNQIRQNLFFEELKTKLNKLNTEKKTAMNLNEELHAHINSQNDLEYMELTLMKVLGVVPEGHTKVFFINEKYHD